MLTYRNHTLHCEEVALTAVADHYATPTYLYSQTTLTANARAYRDAIPQPNPHTLACYAVKANSNPVILRQLHAAGLGADVTSGGELYLAQHAGIPPQQIIYSGVGKTRSEMTMALQSGIRAIHVETAQEVDTIAAIAAELGTVARIGVRVNPNIAADTHPAISTGQKAHKFGVDPETAVAILHRAHTDPHLQPVALASHIGSQITDIAPFTTAAHFLMELAAEMASAGIKLDYLDVGGGLGIDYHDQRLMIEEAPTSIFNHQSSISDWVTAVTTPILQAGYGVVMEPGRSIVGPAGVLLTRIVATKQQGDKQFVIVDAGMSDLLRPTLYDAHHSIVPVSLSAGQPISSQQVVDVVGPICETGDFLAKGRALPPVQPGDLLAILQAGAYGYAMSSNYNGRLRPAEVLISGSNHTQIRPRQTYTDLL